jgi:hypothetical protein
MKTLLLILSLTFITSCSSTSVNNETQAEKQERLLEARRSANERN